MTTTIDGSASVTINSGAVLGITSGTAVASTSGTSIDFTSIPSWVKRITVMFQGVSLSSTSNIRIQLGVSGTPETTGYTGSNGTGVTGFGVNLLSSGFEFTGGASAADIQNGQLNICLLNSNTWTAMGMLGMSNTGRMNFLAGYKTLSGTLNMIRITTSGADTFDAGSINILYE
jgi:hypothetical protein